VKPVVARGLCLLALLVFAAGCTGSGAPAASKAANGARQDGFASGHKAGYAEGFEAAKAKYDPVRHGISNRTSRATLDVEEGAYVVAWLNSSKAFHIEYSVFQYAGPRFDVFALTPGDLGRYRSGHAFEDLEDCADWATSTVHRSCNAPAGSWAIVLDNTKAGGSAPTGEDPVVRVRFSYDAYWTGPTA